MIVYKTTNLINGKIYIGQDSFNNPNYYGSGLLIVKAIKKYGKDNFRKDILEHCVSKEHLAEREIYWIACFNSTDKSVGYNVAIGGKSLMLNRNHTLEAKEKIRKANLGKVYSEETKKKLSLALRGISKTPEHREKMCKARKCRGAVTDETRRRMSIAHKGKKQSEQAKKKVSEAMKGNDYYKYKKKNGKQKKV